MYKSSIVPGIPDSELAQIRKNGHGYICESCSETGRAYLVGVGVFTGNGLTDAQYHQARTAENDYIEKLKKIHFALNPRHVAEKEAAERQAAERRKEEEKRKAEEERQREEWRLRLQAEERRKEEEARRRAEEERQREEWRLRQQAEERRKEEELAQEKRETTNSVSGLTTLLTSISSMFTHIRLVDLDFVANNKAKETKYNNQIQIWQNTINSCNINQLRSIKSQLQTIKSDILVFEKEVKAKLESLIKIKKAEITTLIQDVNKHFTHMHSILDEIKLMDVDFEAAKISEISNFKIAINANENELNTADLARLQIIKDEVESGQIKINTLEQDITDKLTQLKKSKQQEVELALQKIEEASLSLQQKLDEINPSDGAYAQNKQNIKDGILSIIPTVKDQYSLVNLEELVKFNSELTEIQTSLTQLDEEVHQKLNMLKESKITQIKSLILNVKNNYLSIDEMLDKMKELNFSQSNTQAFNTFLNTIVTLIDAFDIEIAQRITTEATLAKETLLDTADLNQLIEIYTEIKIAEEKTQLLKENAEVKLKASYILEAEYLCSNEEFISAKSMLDLADKIFTPQDADFAKRITEVRRSINIAMEDKAVKKIEAELASNQDLQWLLAKMQKPSSLKGKVENKTGIDINELNDLLAKHFDKVINAENREIILFVGLTGSGKSTTINYLLGRSLKNEIALNGETYIVPTQVDNLGNFPTIGTTAKAETLFPAVYQTPSESFAYADFPGFMDNRGELVKVCTHVFSQIAINAATRIREIAVVIECDSLYTQRAAGLRNLATIIGELLKDPRELSNSIRFIITKPKEKKLEHIKYQISSLCTLLENDSSAGKELVILKLMNQAGQNLSDQRIIFVDPVDNGQSRNELIAQFKGTSDGIRKEDFNSTPADTYSKLHEILTLVNKLKNKMLRIVSLSAMVEKYKTDIETLVPKITVSSDAKTLLANLKSQVILMENFIEKTRQELNDNQEMLKIFEKITTLMDFSSAIGSSLQAPLPLHAPQPGSHPSYSP